MAVVVFDADVLIGYLSRVDAHHDEATERVSRSLSSASRRLVSAVNYAEILIGPLRMKGTQGVDAVDAMLDRLSIETVPVDRDLARLAAAVRQGAGVTLPDAFAVATAVLAEQRGHKDVGLESFDADVVKAYASRSSAT